LSSKAAFPALLLILLPLFAFAQAAELVSAERYFDTLSASFGKVSDYIADISIVNGKATYHGRLSYKSPLYLRIDFDDPPKMVLDFDGEKLLWYSPQNAVVLEQDYKKRGGSQIEGMASSQSFSLWKKNFSVAYLSGPAPVPLEDGSREMVTKLKLVSRGSTNFTEMIISVKDTFIRRVEGTEGGGDKVVMDYTNIRTNQGIPDSRFKYDPPVTVNTIQDWLFDSTQ
jgi:outer membrane lipoprotein-sorting protein